jgi:hypothetical protein
MCWKAYVFKYLEQHNVHVTHEGFVHPQKQKKGEKINKKKSQGLHHFCQNKRQKHMSHFKVMIRL